MIRSGNYNLLKEKALLNGLFHLLFRDLEIELKY